MKKKILINGGLILIAIIIFGMGMFLFSQDNNNVADSVNQPNFDIDFTTLIEYPNFFDQFNNILTDNNVLSTGNYYQARRSIITGTSGERQKILTINYISGGIQRQSVSKISYRDFNNMELWYINNDMYNRPFYTIRYELMGDDPANARITRKELINRERKVTEYYEYGYDNIGRVTDMIKYALSPFRDEFQRYESAKYYYPLDEGADTTNPSSFLYYDVMDKDGALKFTFTTPPSYFTNSDDPNISSVNEVFVQYKLGADESAIGLSQIEGEGNVLDIEFNPDNIQFVIAAQTEISEGTETAEGVEVSSSKIFPLILIFNGDGSLRQVINNSAEEE